MSQTIALCANSTVARDSADRRNGKTASDESGKAGANYSRTLGNEMGDRSTVRSPDVSKILASSFTRAAQGRDDTVRARSEGSCSKFLEDLKIFRHPLSKL